ncbi:MULTISPECIES: fimbrillin family protein [Bacteroidales]|uniref:fimbrillin family protein n=1 Tax=Bacteroidales TaxID=171549 RepID=UPI00241F9DA6|nr:MULTISPECIES: fimbrillin family protein [Bacteroidales]
MKRYKAIYFQIWMLAFLFAACSQEEFVPDVNTGNNAEHSLPITFHLQTRTDGSETEIDKMYDAIDRVRIMVFRCPKTEYESNKSNAQFTYVSGCITPSEIVECKLEKGKQWRSAKATFTPLKDEDGTAYAYRIYAVAYSIADSIAGKITFNVDNNRRLYYENMSQISTSDVEKSGCAYVQINQATNKKFDKVMFFAGPVGYSEAEYKKINTKITDEEFTDDLLFSDDIKGNLSLTGYLYRATGAMTISLTKIDPEYTSMRLIMEHYSDKALIGIGTKWALWRDDQKLEPGVLYKNYYPIREGNNISFPTFFDVFINNGPVLGPNNETERKFSWETQHLATVCEKNIENGNVVLNTSCMGVEGFKLYVQPIKEDGSAGGIFQILCKDQVYYPGFVGIADNIVKDGVFTLISNVHLKLSGEYSRLNNLRIETDWDEDYEIDDSLQPVTGN